MTLLTFVPLLLLASISVVTSSSLARPFRRIFSKYPFNRHPPLTQNILDYPKLTYENLTVQDKYDLQWYVVGTPSDFSTNQPQKVTVWNKNYVIWRNEDGQYIALDDVCSHKGASLSGGYVHNHTVVCPYHGYEFDSTGTLQTVPGICFHPSPVHRLAKFDVVEKHGWVYLNTFSDLVPAGTMCENIFVEEEALHTVGGDPSEPHTFSVVYLDMDFNCYSRILSENSLDVMHIGFVHTFGNRKNPAPREIYPPRLEGPHHFKTSYMYEAGENSLARKIFKVNDLIIENEFILPHTTVARVIFDQYVSTVVTFALPISETKSKLFVKTYRNFWQNPMGDKISADLMYQTMLQDKAIVENIHPLFEDGKFNMRFDKLQNTYKMFYKRLVHRKKGP